jgi:ribokinase
MRAICVGSAMVDIIAIVASRDVERLTMHNATASYLLLEQGRKIESESISTHIGGGAVNAAVAMARLDVDVSALIKIGQDSNGAQIIDRLAHENVDDGLAIRTAELPTGTAVMVSSHNRNATIFTQRGTNTLLRPSEITPEMFEGCDLVYVTNLSNRSADCFPVVVERGREAGAFVAANPGIRQLTSRTAAFLDNLKNIDLLAINRVEAEALVPVISALDDVESVSDENIAEENIPPLMRVGLACGGFDLALPEFFARIRRYGVTNVVVTDGTDGAYLADDDGVHFCPTVTTEPKGTAGAGDAFTSTLCTHLAGGEAPELAMRAAAVNSAAVVEVVDTQSGLLSQTALNNRIEAEQTHLPVTTWTWAKLA